MTTVAPAHIDKVIAMHTSSIRNVCSRSDAVAPICRLPFELLVMIFIQCAVDDYDYPYIARNVPSWVNISYVCRYWRNVALDCPTLWTYHFAASHRWTEELLSRSRQRSLNIRLAHESLKDELWPRLVDKLMNHVERIQEFHLDNFTHHIFSALSHSLRAPRLQDLKILLKHNPFQQHFVLFQGDTPALRTLELKDCPVMWHSFNTGALTSLSPQHVPNWLQQSMKDFLSTLRCMQDLTYLHLDKALTSATGFLSSALFESFEKIDLPHLTRFFIAAPLSTVIASLSCIKIPLNAEVRLQCHSEATSLPRDYTLFSSLLAQRFSVSEDQAPPIIRSFAVKFIYCGQVQLVFSASERDCDFVVGLSRMEWGCNIPLKVLVDSSLYRLINQDPIINDICHSLPMTNVRSVHVLHPPTSPAFWRILLGHFQDLRYLKLSDGSMPDLAFVLSSSALTSPKGLGNQGQRAVGDQDKLHIFAPALEELGLDKISFSSEAEHDTDLTSGITQRHLFDALSIRGANVPQGRLTMTRCNTDGRRPFFMIRLWDGRIEFDSSQADPLPTRHRVLCLDSDLDELAGFT